MSLGGLFAHRTATRGGVASRQAKARKRAEALDSFAELLADEVRPEDADRPLGYAPAYGRVLLGRLRKRLGIQAV